MAVVWNNTFQTKAASWNIPAAELTALQHLTAEAEAKLQLAKSAERSIVITAQCNAAFGSLKEKMRFIKKHYLLSPPLEAPDYPALLLSLHDGTPSQTGRPTGHAVVMVGYHGVHALILNIQPMPESSNPRGDWVYGIYEGIMPHGGATLEEAASPKHYLMKPPVAGEELLYWRSTRRKKEIREYPAEEAGKTAYFSVRCENQRGETGPWGPIVSAVIP
jgi:hypothetical protein